MDLKEKVNNLPSSPGVYLMKDSLNSVIYVGKSKNLKSRVRSYFYNSKSHSPKVVKLVKNLKDFDYILTDTEFEAFLLECKLIKEIKPIYNRLMKNPKSYCYIVIKINEKYPCIDICSEIVEDDGNIYFGPYTSKGTVERGVQGIKEHYKILCNNIERKSSSCLNYSLGLCMGMCLDNSPKEQYDSIINKVINLFKEHDKFILEDMENEMIKASENLDFEKAGKYRDLINSITYMTNTVKVIKHLERNRNIALLEPLNSHGCKFFLIRGNKVLFSEKYSLDNTEKLKSTLESAIASFFSTYTVKNSIKIDKDELDEAQIIYNYLKSKANNCRYAIIPEKWLKNPNSISTNIDKYVNKLIR